MPICLLIINKIVKVKVVISLKCVPFGNLFLQPLQMDTSKIKNIPLMELMRVKFLINVPVLNAFLLL